MLTSVSDTGIGIPLEVIDKIFEPFSTTKEIGKGTGLGLSTVQAIVKSHGGFLNVYSEVGRGTTFKVYLPALESQEALPEPEERPLLPPGHGEMILVVDDEASIRDITKETLETYGYNVLAVAEGAEALALYVKNKGKIAVVITDMMMPYMDGYTTVRALRKLDSRAKIIAASG